MCNRQKPITRKEVEDLEVIVKNRTARMRWLAAQAKVAKKSDLGWIAKEIKEHETFVKNAERQIKAFYAPKGVVS